MIQYKLLLLKNEVSKMSQWLMMSLQSKKMKRGKSDIDVNNDSWGVIRWVRFSSKGEPVRIVGNA